MKEELETFLQDALDLLDKLTSQQQQQDGIFQDVSTTLVKDPHELTLRRLESNFTSQALAQLEETLEQLNDKMEQVHQRQMLLASIQEIDEHMSEYNRNVLETVRKLHLSDSLLSQVLDHARLAQKTAHQARQGKVPIQDLISYAHRISKYSTAPFNWTPQSTNTGVPVYPPIPQDMHMKRSLLFQPDPSKPMAASTDMAQQQEVAMDMDLLTQHLQGTEAFIGEEVIVEEEELLDLDL